MKDEIEKLVEYHWWQNGNFETVSDCKKSAIKAISNLLEQERERIEKILDKYYVYAREDGDYEYDPSGNQLIDTLRQDLKVTKE